MITKLISRARRIIKQAVSDSRNRTIYHNNEVILINWWSGEDIHQCWFFRFMQEKKIIIKRPLAICSVFGPYKNITNVSATHDIIFFIGEEISRHPEYSSYCFDITKSLSLGFDQIENPHYLRFPLWILGTTDPRDSLQKIHQRVVSANNLGLTQREIFGAMIANHDNGGNLAGIRTKIFNHLKELGTVESCGKLLKNSSRLQNLFGDDKRKYLSTVKFCICPENHSSTFYTTEKIFDSLLSGAIPIYCGSNNLPEPLIINKKSYILWNNLEDMGNNPIAEITRLMDCPEYYAEFFTRPRFKNDSHKIIYQYFNDLERRIVKLVD